MLQKISLVSMGCQAEGQSCVGPRTNDPHRRQRKFLCSKHLFAFVVCLQVISRQFAIIFLKLFWTLQHGRGHTLSIPGQRWTWRPSLHRSQGRTGVSSEERQRGSLCALMRLSCLVWKHNWSNVFPLCNYIFEVEWRLHLDVVQCLWLS